MKKIARIVVYGKKSSSRLQETFGTSLSKQEVDYVFCDFYNFAVR